MTAPPALPVSMTLDLGTAPVAAYWIRGQRVHGSLDSANDGPVPLELALDARTSHLAFSVSLGVSALTLAPGERRRLPVEIAVAPDVWANFKIQVAVRARTADGAQRSATAQIVTSADAPPLAEAQVFPLPSAMLGGFDVASTALGSRVVAPDGDPTIEAQRLLHDGVTFPGGFTAPADALPLTLTVAFGGDRVWPIAGVALHPQAGTDWIYPPEQLKAFDLLLSEDGVHFEPVLSGELSIVQIEQAFLLDHPRPARAAQLRLKSNHADNIGKIGLGEWKLITVPGIPEGLSVNIADAARGGHLVYSNPAIGSSYAEARELLQEGGPSMPIEPAAGPPTWVIGFQDDRAAQIASLEWVDQDQQYKPLRVGRRGRQPGYAARAVAGPRRLEARPRQAGGGGLEAAAAGLGAFRPVRCSQCHSAGEAGREEVGAPHGDPDLRAPDRRRLSLDPRRMGLPQPRRHLRSHPPAAAGTDGRRGRPQRQPGRSAAAPPRRGRGRRGPPERR